MSVQVYYESDIGMAEFGFVLNTVIVIVVSFHLAVETLHWVCTVLQYYHVCMLISSVCRFDVNVKWDTVFLLIVCVSSIQ